MATTLDGVDVARADVARADVARAGVSRAGVVVVDPSCRIVRSN
jgi:hypothetical protein